MFGLDLLHRMCPVFFAAFSLQACVGVLQLVECSTNLKNNQGHNSFG